MRFSPALDPNNRAATAEAEVDNADGALMAGMYCRVTIDLGGRDDALLVPLKALVEGKTERGEPERPGPVGVRGPSGGGPSCCRSPSGSSSVGQAEVLDGLEASDQVVIEGQTRLARGAQGPRRRS